MINSTIQAKGTQPEYQLALNQYLLQHADTNAQLFALLASDFFDSNTAKPILVKAIKETNNAYTLYLVDDLCHKHPEITTWCHQQEIHNKHIAIDPNNVFSYLFKLHDATDVAEIETIIETTVKKGKYSNDFYFDNIFELQSIIKTFNNSHKDLYAKAIEFKNERYDSLNKEAIQNNLVQQGALNLSKIKKQLNSLPFIMSVKMANIFDTDLLEQSCTYSSNHEFCSKIFQLFLKDKTVSIYVAGKRAIIHMLSKKESSRNELLAKLKTNRVDDFMCYMGSDSVMLLYIFDMEIMTKYLATASIKDEFEAAKQTSHHVYNLLQQKGIKPDFNPKDCE
jgi:hypothetical protein